MIRVVALLLALLVSSAQAQNSFVTPGNSISAGNVQMCISPAGPWAVPCNGTPVVVTFSGADTSSQNLTIPTPSAGHWNFTCGFTVGGLGATALTNVSLTMNFGGSSQVYTYSYPAGATVAATTLSVTYNPCIPSAVFSSQILTVPGAAGNTSTTITLTGYTL